MNIAFDLIVGTAFGAAFAVGVIIAMHSNNPALRVFFATRTFHNIAISQAYPVARIEAKIAFGGRFHEIFLLNPLFSAD